MSAVLEAAPDGIVAAAPPARTWPLFWSVRRELWENRSLYIAPFAVAALVIGAYGIGTVHLPHILATHACTPGPCQTPPAGLPYSIAGIAVMLTGMLVGVFYCLGALYGERRDRGILFWKSLPVSDLVTVAAKASIVFLVLPAIIFVIIMAMQLVMLALGGIIGLTHGAGIPAFWSQWPFFRMSLVLLYGLVTLVLWHAPIYGWLLLVSGWARRTPFLWAVVPPVALCLAEKIAFDSSTLGALLAGRLAGSFGLAFNTLDQDGGPIQLAQLTPIRFLSTPDLWIGLALTIVFLGAAVRLRRHRGAL